jgi:hypothetical protein
MSLENPRSDFDKFEFYDGLLYHDGLLNVSEGFMQFQISKLDTTHWLLAILDSTKPCS